MLIYNYHKYENQQHHCPSHPSFMGGLLSRVPVCQLRTTVLSIPRGLVNCEEFRSINQKTLLVLSTFIQTTLSGHIWKFWSNSYVFHSQEHCRHFSNCERIRQKHPNPKHKKFGEARKRGFPRCFQSSIIINWYWAIHHLHPTQTRIISCTACPRWWLWSARGLIRRYSTCRNHH